MAFTPGTDREPVSEVKAHRTHRRLVAHADANGVGVVVYELPQIDIAVNVSAVIEEHGAQIVDDFRGNRASEFRMKSMLPPTGTLMRVQVDGLPGVAANVYRPLRPRAVDGKTAQRIRAAGEKSLAQRNLAAGKGWASPRRRLLAQTSHGLHRNVKRALPEKANEIGARSKGRRRDTKIEGLVNAVVRVERIVAAVANIFRGNRGKPHVLILRQHQVRNLQIAQIGALKAVAQNEFLVRSRIEISLHLERAGSQTRSDIAGSPWCARPEMLNSEFHCVPRSRGSEYVKAALVQPRKNG